MTVQELKSRGNTEGQQQPSGDILLPELPNNGHKSSETNRNNYQQQEQDSENLLGRVLAGKTKNPQVKLGLKILPSYHAF